MRAKHKPHRRWVYWLPFLLVAVIVGEVALRPAVYQWDYRVYYHAARAYDAGQDPYDLQVLQQSSGLDDIFPFLYPPLTLEFFRPFALLPFGLSYYIWLGLKLLAAIVLLIVWQSRFLRSEPWWLLILFSVFAFGGAFSLDIRAGNVTLIEQALLWLGLAALLDRRVGAFCILVVASSFFKWTTILFLGLLPFVQVPRKWSYGGLASAAFLGMIAVNYIAYPGLFGRFLEQASHHPEAAHQANLSSFTLVKYLTSHLGRLGMEPAFLSMLAWFLFAGIVAGVTYLLIRTIRNLRSKGETQVELLIYTACLAYVVAMPRFKHYAFIILVPVALVVIRRYLRPHSFWLLFILISLSVNPRLPGRSILVELWWFYPMLVAMALLLYWARWIATDSETRLPEEVLPVAETAGTADSSS